MRLTYLYTFFIFSFILSGCSTNQAIENMNPNPPAPPVTPKPYSITETFEEGKKTAYAEDSVSLSTGKWDFNDALIGNLASDLKDGAQSVRLRTGDIAMDFDIKGLNTLYIKHGKYGSDAASVWQLLMSTDGGKTYTQVGSDIQETNTTLVTDSFKVAPVSTIRFEIKKTGTTRINIDDITFKGAGDPGIVPGTPDNGSDTSNQGSASAPRLVTVGADSIPSSGDNSNLLFGNPSNAQPSMVSMDNYLINQNYYVESYSASRAEPNWVSWHLDAGNTTNATSRLNDFAGWAGIPQGWYQVQSNSYSGSGFDRGHNCPSADRTSSDNANAATFLMTNMIPQAPQNNQETWANLENYLREQVVEGNEVYIVMGSYGMGGAGTNGMATTINNGHVTVPSNIYKIAVILPVGNGDLDRVNESTRVIAVDTPNMNSVSSDWTQYITTIKAIETATGYTFLSALPANVRTALETKKDPGSV